MSLNKINFKSFFDINEFPKRKLSFAVIVAKHNGRYVLVKHKQRDTWENPGGKVEKNERILQAAKRELEEETGATKYKIYPVSAYSLNKKGFIYHGMLYYAEIFEFGELKDSEIGRIKFFDESPDNLTYPLIHPSLESKVIEYLSNKDANISSN